MKTPFQLSKSFVCLGPGRDTARGRWLEVYELHCETFCLTRKMGLLDTESGSGPRLELWERTEDV